MAKTRAIPRARRALAALTLALTGTFAGCAQRLGAEDYYYRAGRGDTCAELLVDVENDNWRVVAYTITGAWRVSLVEERRDGADELVILDLTPPHPDSPVPQIVEPHRFATTRHMSRRLIVELRCHPAGDPAATPAVARRFFSPFTGAGGPRDRMGW